MNTETEKYRCEGCGKSFDRQDVHYHSDRKRGVHRFYYYCGACNEKYKQVMGLKTAKTNYQNSRSFKPGYSSYKRY